MTLVFLAAWLAAGALDPERFHAGILQRLFVAPVLLWLGVTALQLRRSLPGDHR